MADLTKRQPYDLFRDTTDVRRTNAVSHVRQMEDLKDKERTLDILEAQLKITNRLTKLQRLQLENDNLDLENQIVIQDKSTLDIQLQQAQTKTQIEAGKLAALQHDAKGYQALAGLYGRKWNQDIRRMELELQVNDYELQALEARAEYLTESYNPKKLDAPYRVK